MSCIQTSGMAHIREKPKEQLEDNSHLAHRIPFGEHSSHLTASSAHGKTRDSHHSWKCSDNHAPSTLKSRTSDSPFPATTTMSLNTPSASVNVRFFHVLYRSRTFCTALLNVASLADIEGKAPSTGSSTSRLLRLMINCCRANWSSFRKA